MISINSEKDKEISVFFPFAVLKSDETLLDPLNTETVWEYYLLENLSIGLVRDSLESVRGYTPELASSWKQLTDHQWQFWFEKSLKWSDGSNISAKQINDYILSLKNRRSRHLIQLKSLEKVEQRTENSFVLTFNKRTSKTLLHELSLADSTLLHPSNKDWTITSGPFYVERYDIKKKKIKLVQNIYWKNVRSNGPTSVNLFNSSLVDMLDLWKDNDVDIYSSSPFLSADLKKSFVQASDRMKEGHPINIFFFYFPKLEGLAENVNARKEFGWLVQEAFSKFEDRHEVKKSSQMIPSGFSGYLQNHKAVELEGISLLKDKKIIIDVYKGLKEYDSFFHKIKEIGLQYGVSVELKYFKYGEESSISFAKFSGFKGNQSDPLGSWMFLFSEKHGPFKEFRDDFMGLIQNAADETQEKKRMAILEEVHRKVLDEYIGVPFLIKASPVFFSDRVDLSNWNPFDMRLRLYDVVVE